jgi:hypothetical protein
MLRPTIGTLDVRSAHPAPKTADPFYLSQAWRKLVEDLIVARFGSKANTQCEDPACRSHGRRGIRVFGDHIKERKDGGAELDPANVRFLCGSCHTTKTTRARARRMAAKPTGGGPVNP